MNAPNDIHFQKYLHKTTKNLHSISGGFIFFSVKKLESLSNIFALENVPDFV